jgi:hypothetical protein
MSVRRRTDRRVLNACDRHVRTVTVLPDPCKNFQKSGITVPGVTPWRLGRSPHHDRATGAVQLVYRLPGSGQRQQ